MHPSSCDHSTINRVEQISSSEFSHAFTFYARLCSAPLHTNCIHSVNLRYSLQLELQDKRESQLLLLAGKIPPAPATAEPWGGCPWAIQAAYLQETRIATSSYQSNTRHHNHLSLRNLCMSDSACRIVLAEWTLGISGRHGRSIYLN